MNKEYEIVKFIDGEFELDVNVSPNEETIWLNTEEIALLFEVDRSVITKHIRNIYNDKELSLNSTCAIFAQVQIEGNRKIERKIKFYNLDMIISIGYRVNSKRGIVFRKWANQVLKEYLIKGYKIDNERAIITKDNYINLVNQVAKLDYTQEDIKNRLSNIETKINNYEISHEKIFFNGQFYDAYTLIEKIFEKANKEIILMDSYIDRTVLDRLTKKKKGVNVIIYTKYNAKRITQTDIDTVNIQYPNIKLIEVNNLHDRYIIIDRVKLYHVGTSIKDAGRKTFSIHEVDHKLINMLLKGVTNI